MAITREQPTARTPIDDEDDLYEPITEAPKKTKRETLLQRKREKAGLQLMQVFAFLAGLLGRFKVAPVLPEDIAAVHLHARPIAKTVADVADEDERFAAVFDRITDMGPYGALFAAVTPLIVQIYVNHKKEIRNDPALAMRMGAVPPDVLMQMVMKEQQEAEEAFAAGFDVAQGMNGDGAPE